MMLPALPWAMLLAQGLPTLRAMPDAERAAMLDRVAANVRAALPEQDWPAILGLVDELRDALTRGLS